MGWGEAHGPLVGTGTTAEISLAQAALVAVGITQPNLARGAIEAAGVITRLREELDEAQLRSIEARNPGIDMEEVRRTRAERTG